MKDPYMHARVEVAGMLGLRPGEALGLKWADLNAQESTLRVARQVQRIKGKGLVVKSVKQKKGTHIANLRNNNSNFADSQEIPGTSKGSMD
jgi:integrase